MTWDILLQWGTTLTLSLGVAVGAVFLVYLFMEAVRRAVAWLTITGPSIRDKEPKESEIPEEFRREPRDWENLGS